MTARLCTCGRPATCQARVRIDIAPPTRLSERYGARVRGSRLATLDFCEACLPADAQVIPTGPRPR